MVAWSVLGAVGVAGFVYTEMPLFEVPVLISLVNVSLWAKRRFFAEQRRVEAAEKVAVSPQSNQEVSTNV
jgi:hypothetical protein